MNIRSVTSIVFVFTVAGLPFLCAAEASAQRGVDHKDAPPPPPPAEDLKTLWLPPPKVVVSSDAPQAHPGGPVENIDRKPTAVAHGLPISPAIDPDRVYFDMPGDGAIWAHGHNFKVSFSQLGFTFVPFFGSRAPKNYPISFDVHSLRTADRFVEARTHVAPAQDGNRITYDRGDVLEIYDIGPTSVHQFFVLPGPALQGPATLRVQVHTELDVIEDAAGLTFANELGAVTYSSAIVLDATGASTAAPTGWADGAIEIRLPARTATSVSGISSTCSLNGTESAPRATWHPEALVSALTSSWT